ncbi:MAG: prepilin-type N-terminal cleavage/methylation domain-containing protein [Deltaproteobacteria bacterium]|nr:prepilin-type N-terminal cleavage/methylation domain-containing protein [Deltaproteobacteria bacterium]
MRGTAKRPRHARGFTLIEAMMASVLAAVIIAPLTAAVMNINRTIIETKKRTALRSDAKLIGEYLAATVQGVGGDVVRPYMAALVENGSSLPPPTERGCRAIAGLPACDGSDRLTFMVQDQVRPVCTVLGNAGVNLQVDDSAGCCLDNGPGFTGQQALVVGASGIAVSVFLNTRTGSCNINAPPGLGSGVLPGTLASVGYPASLVVVSGRMIYVDRTTHALMMWIDATNPGAADADELTVLADNVWDLQLAPGYDALPQDGHVVDLDDGADEVLFNDTTDPSFPGEAGPFVNVRDVDLRTLRMSFAVGTSAQFDTGNSVLLLDGPTRSATGFYLEPTSVSVMMRNLNVFTQ